MTGSNLSTKEEDPQLQLKQFLSSSLKKKEEHKEAMANRLEAIAIGLEAIASS